MKDRFLEEILQHQALIHKVCSIYRDTREDREDLFQEITYQLWKSYPKFQARSKISSWIYKISLNTAMTTFRKPKIRISDNGNNLENIEVADITSEDDRMDRLFIATKKLNDAERALLVLYLEDMSYKEIADILGISENYVGVRLNRIKEKIKKLLNV